MSEGDGGRPGLALSLSSYGYVSGRPSCRPASSGEPAVSPPSRREPAAPAREREQPRTFLRSSVPLLLSSHPRLVCIAYNGSLSLGTVSSYPTLYSCNGRADYTSQRHENCPVITPARNKRSLFRRTVSTRGSTKICIRLLPQLLC